MKKRIVYTLLIILSSLILLWATLNWIYGSKTQRFIDSELPQFQASLKQIAPNLVLLAAGHEKGIFSSNYTFELRQQSTKKPLLRINFDISHGPFVRFNQLGLANAQIDFALLPDGEKLLPVSLTETIQAKNNARESDSSKNEQSAEELNLNNFVGNLLILDANNFELTINLPYLDSQNLMPIKLALEQPVFKYNQTDSSEIPQFSVAAKNARITLDHSANGKLEIVSPNLVLGINQPGLAIAEQNGPQANQAILPITLNNLFMPEKGFKNTLRLDAESLKADNITLNQVKLETTIEPSKKSNLSAITVALGSEELIYHQSRIGKIESKFFADHINFPALIELFDAAELRYKTAVANNNAVFPKYVYYFAQWLENSAKILADQPSFGMTPIKVVNEAGEFNLDFDWRLQTEAKLPTLEGNTPQINNRIFSYLLTLTQSFGFELSMHQPIFAKLVEQFLLQQSEFEKSNSNNQLREKHHALLFALNEMNNTKPFVTFRTIEQESKEAISKDNKNKEENNQENKKEQNTQNAANTQNSFLSDQSILNVSFKYDVNKNQVMLNKNTFSLEQFFDYLKSIGI